LGESFQEPQVQSDLELSQTNLILQASELKAESLGWGDLSRNLSLILGKDTIKVAQEQYQSAQAQGEEQLKKLEKNLRTQPTLNGVTEAEPELALREARQNKPDQLEKITQSKLLLQKIDLKLGLIAAHQGKVPEAIAAWQAVLKLDTEAKKYEKTPAQLILRWAIQQEISSIPKSANTIRIKENFNIFNFNIEESDILKMNQFDEHLRLIDDPMEMY
jgi:hypothetical protein